MAALDSTKFSERARQTEALNITLLWALWRTNFACAVAAIRLVDTVRARLQGVASAMDAAGESARGDRRRVAVAGTGSDLAVTRAKLGLTVAAEELAGALEARRAWLTAALDHRQLLCVEPRYVFAEFWNSSLLWESQVDLLARFMGAVDSGGSLVQQLLMGQGKTQVLCPLLVLMLGDGCTLTTLVTPAELVPQLVGPLAALTSNAVLDVPLMRLRVTRGCGRNSGAPGKETIGTGTVPVCLREGVSEMMGALSQGGGMGRRKATRVQPRALADGGGGGTPGPSTLVGQKRNIVEDDDSDSDPGSAMNSWPLSATAAMAGTLHARSLRLALVRIRRCGGVVVAPPEVLKALMLAFAELQQQIEQCSRSAAELGAVLAMMRTRSEAHRSVAILDECDVLMHPLRSELNYPLGAPIGLPLGDMRYKLAAHLVEAFVTIAALARAELVSRGGRVASVIAAYESAARAEKQEQPQKGRRRAATAPGDWVCAACTSINMHGISECAICRAPRPPEMVDLTSSQGHSNSQASAPGASESKKADARSGAGSGKHPASAPTPSPPLPTESLADRLVHIVGDSRAARGATARLQAALVAAADANAVMLVPYFELLSKDYYTEHIAGPVAELAVCWLRKECPATVGACINTWIAAPPAAASSGQCAVPANTGATLDAWLVRSAATAGAPARPAKAGGNLDSWLVRSSGAPPPGPRPLVRLTSEPGMEALPIGSPLRQVVHLVSTAPCAGIATDETPGYSAAALRRAFTPHAMQQLLLAQSLVAAVLPLALRRQPRVHYGLLESVEGEPLTRRLLAVPFLGKDSPSPSSEFSHPDVRTVMTCLACVQQRQSFFLVSSIARSALRAGFWLLAPLPTLPCLLCAARAGITTRDCAKWTQRTSCSRP